MNDVYNNPKHKIEINLERYPYITKETNQIKKMILYILHLMV